MAGSGKAGMASVRLHRACLPGSYLPNIEFSSEKSSIRQMKKTPHLHNLTFIPLFLFTTAQLCAQWQPQPWPSLKHYDQDHLTNIAMPLGGIGTGTVSLGGRGELRDWEIINKPAKGFSTVTTGNDAPF